MIEACQNAVLAAVLLATASPLCAQTIIDRAHGALERSQFDSAYALAQQAAKDEPGRADIQFLLGQAACGKLFQGDGLLSALASARRCKAAYGRAVELEPSNLAYLEALAGFLSQAPGIAGGDRDSALKLAEVVRARDDVRGTIIAANALARGDPRQKARADSLMEYLARAGLEDRGTLISVAQYWTTTDRPERALAIDERLAARDTMDYVARFGIGRNLVVLRRELAVAQAHLRFAMRAPPNPPGGLSLLPGTPSIVPGAPWWRLGQSFVQLNLPDSARFYFEEALRVNPRLSQARRSLDSLQRH